MNRTLLGLLGLLAFSLPTTAWAQNFFGPPVFVAQAFKYSHITTDTTTDVKSGKGLLGGVCINNPAAGETITLYDNTSATGTIIGVITLSTTSIGCFYYDAVLTTGLTVVTATAAGDLTILYQ